ncbi:GTP 3',8-cyclase MoaA [Aquabacterium sp.]|uniref:GTP 3',8-cyclase MoaA n=1 Tax=Aquabacterium sp. TaxID=1872578 RepID=UPI003D6C9EE0
MSESTLVPLQRLREQLRTPRTSPILPTADSGAGAAEPLDRLGRPLRDLRISVTDRCNFRCSYCMPRDVFGSDHPFLPQSQLLSFEEITRTARIFMGLGVRKLRLTGGEPLLRRHLEKLITDLSGLRTLDGTPPDLTLTTNGSLLARKAQALKDAGLNRITVSLDALDDTVFKRMNDADFPVADVLEGIQAAQAVGLGPIKVNMVVQRGVNDEQILPMARYFRGTGVELRFIEFMDVGNTNAWKMDQVLPSSQVRQRIQGEFPLKPVAGQLQGETAERWAYADGLGSVGFISSVTQAFCGDCNRLRLSTDGQLFTCLFASRGHDLRPLLRAEHSDADIASGLRLLWAQREDQYSQRRAAQGTTTTPVQRIEMSYIGG